MSATARAEARRKAILSRGTDRLAKLTVTARGEDAPAYMSESSSTGSATGKFLGDESDMPLPSTSSATSASSTTLSPAAAGASSTKRAVSAGNGVHPLRPPSSTTSARSTSASSASNRFDSAGGAPAGLGRIPTPDPSVWSVEQQQQFMRALMGASAAASSAGQDTPMLQSPLGDPNAPLDPTLPPLDNPLAAMLFGGAAGAGAGVDPKQQQGLLFPPGFQPQHAPDVSSSPPPRKFQKYLPLVHLVVLWALLGYFVFWFEPKVYEANVVDAFPSAGGLWARWRELVGRSPVSEAGLKRLQVQIAPFFWAFITVEVMLHSIQIFTGSNTVQPPSILAMFLPQLPPPIPSIVINSLKYFRMFSMFLDDVAGVIVGLGFIIYFAGFLSV
ncbi:hypothetical protein MD484_g4753, partial [Candolleomyces efflorescens]